MANYQSSLMEAFRRTAYRVAGHMHGPRNVDVLKEAFRGVDGTAESDVYGSGNFIHAFEQKIADYLGKPAAVFFPSGTMAQQIALRIWSDRQGIAKVAYHPLCHLEIHEQNGLKMLHRIEPVLLADADRLITPDDVKGLTEPVSTLLLELPQREIGGQLPPFAELETIAAWCREHHIRLHMDGARLYESLPYYQKSAAEVASLFDSVYVSFYKGIGGIAGAVLAGPEDFIQEAVVWKRRHGGDLISLYPYIVAADYYFDQRVHKMEQYYHEAQELAALFNACAATSTTPQVPVTNMFHVYFAHPKSQVEPVLVQVYETSGVGLAGGLRAVGDDACSFEISIGDAYASIPKEKLQQAFDVLNTHLHRLR